MQLYSKYIARQLVHATLLVTISITSIVWLMQALRFIDYIVNQGVSILLFLKLTLLLIPSLALTILPPAYFCAIIFTYNKMKTDSELVVMQAMGLDRWRLTKPALRVGIILVIIAYAISLYIQPMSMRAFRDLQNFLRNNYVSILLQEGVFSSPVEGLTVFIRERHNDGTLQGILVHDNRKPGSEITMMADQGILVQTPSGPRFLMQDGNRQEVKNGKLSLLNYKSYTLDISLYTGEAAARTRDVPEMYLHELLENDATLSDKERTRRLSEAHQRLIWPAYVITLTFLSLAVMLSGQFNRRSGWKRITIMVVFGSMLLFMSATLSNFVAKHPDLAFLIYAWWFIPTAAAAMVLWRDSPIKKTRTEPAT